MLAWVLLAVAIVTEVCGTVALRESDGFRKPAPTAFMLVAYVIAFFLISVVARQLAISTIYAIWSGAGTALIATIGVVAFDEGVSPLKVGSLALIVLGIIGLNLAGAHR
jgi:small multidrug resistance pump